jgi:hypothetical protein
MDGCGAVPRNISYAVPYGTRACAGSTKCDVGCAGVRASSGGIVHAVVDGVPDFPAANAGGAIGRTTGRSTTRIRTRDDLREAHFARDDNELPGVP